LAHAAHDGVVVMDVDLQDPPDLILEMVALWQNGAKVVLAQRIDRSDDGYLKRTSAQWFYRLHNRLSNIQIPDNVGDYRLMDRQVVAAVNQLPESRRFMKGLFACLLYTSPSPRD
jgi:glycosyltransferase involved in cell wall biosynthesis